MLTRFDNELRELDASIKTKRQQISDSELQLKKLEHESQALAKERVTAVNAVANLEKMYEWIPEEKQYVIIHIHFFLFCLFLLLFLCICFL